MSLHLLNLVWRRYEGTGNKLLTALALADYAWDDGTHIFPAVATIATKSRQSKRSVQGHLRTMQDEGFLVLVSDHKGGRSKTVEYAINPQWIENGAELAPFRKGCKPPPERVQNDALKGADSASDISKSNRLKDRGIVLPAWLDVDAWMRWRGYRRLELHKPLTEKLELRQLEMLDKHRADHVQIIEKSMTNGWTGLFPLKPGDRHGTHQRTSLTAPEQVRDAIHKRHAQS